MSVSRKPISGDLAKVMETHKSGRFRIERGEVVEICQGFKTTSKISPEHSPGLELLIPNNKIEIIER